MLKAKKIPLRRCVACFESKPKQELLRISFKEGKAFVDNKNDGRGAYICKNEECVNLAKKKQAIKKHFKANIPDEIYDVIKGAIKNG